MLSFILEETQFTTEVVLTFAQVCDYSNESYWAILHEYFHVVLFVMLYKVVLTFKSVDKTLVCDHSNYESYWAVLSFMWCCHYYVLYKMILTFRSVDETLVCALIIQIKATEKHVHVVLFIMLYKVVLSFKSVD